MSKWAKDYILVLQESGTSAKEKNIISESAMEYANFHNIPQNCRFSTRDRETSNRSFFDVRPFDFKGGFAPLVPGSLSPITIDDKLYIFAHADSVEVGFAGARNVAGLLSSYGLKSVGLITFKACNVGSADFLDRFVSSVVSHGIILGWAKGYKGTAATVHYADGKPKENIREKRKNAAGEVEKVLLTGDARIKIVSSPNNPYSASRGRYKVA